MMKTEIKTYIYNINIQSQDMVLRGSLCTLDSI